MKVFFLGNHTVGVRTLETLLESDQVIGVVAHPHDPEDGVDYLSVYDFAREKGLDVVRMHGRDRNLPELIHDCKPDLVWVTDYRYLLPPSVLSAAPLGTVNLHPSLLPKYRGRAPINWAILNGEKELGLTAHFVDGGMDTGDIIAQITYNLNTDQDVADALEILYPLYRKVTRHVLNCFRAGQVPRKAQDQSQASAFPRRRPKDGLIDWGQSARRIRDLVRAVAPPYPGAFSHLRHKRIKILSAGCDTERPHIGVPGEIVGRRRNGFVVATGKGSLLVKKAILAEDGRQVIAEPGEILENR